MVFTPQFVSVPSLAEAANLINKPHEDYPLRVAKTLDVLETILASKAGDLLCEISAFEARVIHSMIMWDLPSRGAWRTIQVTVNGYTPPPPERLWEYLNSTLLFPAGTWVDFPQWYKAFQEVHPFEDGNGRVGGVIVAILSHALSHGKEILAPLQ